MKLYMRVNKMNKWGALAHYSRAINKQTRKISREHITIFLPRIYRYLSRKKESGTTYSWDDMFSHCVSHEHIHWLLQHEISEQASTDFDNIAGHPPKNPFEVYAGLRL